MSCYNCNKILKYAGLDLCGECKFDPAIVISKSEAKMKYKLTENDLVKANLFNIQFEVHRNVGTKYLIKDIEKLAENLTKDLDPMDKRRLAYDKQKEKMKIINQKREKAEERKNNILICLRDLLVKSKDMDGLDIDKYINDFEFNQMLNTYVANSDLSEMDVVMDLMIKLESKINVEKNRMLRQQQIDNKIENELDAVYKSKAKKHWVYYDFINGTGDLETCFTNLKKVIEQMDKIIKRKQK